jgi:cytochrome P450
MPDSLPPGPTAPSLVQAVRFTFDFSRFSAENRKRYGHTWTARPTGHPPCVVTSDREAIRRLFTGDPLTKRHGSDFLEFLLGARSVALLEPSEHLVRRRLEAGTFHTKRVQGYTTEIRGLLEEEVDGWAPEATVAVHPRAQRLTLRVVLELILGVRDERFRGELIEIFDAMVKPHNTLTMFLPALTRRGSRWRALSHPFRSLVARLDSLLARHIAEARRDPGLAEREDVLAMLMCARDADGNGLSDADLRDELVTLVVAGHETTATAMGWGADLLANSPEVVERLRVTLAAGERDYLKAAAKEILRARTVVTVGAARRVLEPFPIGDHVVDENAILIVDAHGVHGDPALHPDPEAYRPERFLDADAEPYSFLPFGGGAHRCLGGPLAMLWLELFIETLVTRRDLRPVEAPAKPMRRGVTLAPSTQGRIASVPLA